jgi:hypothetical protein
MEMNTISKLSLIAVLGIASAFAQNTVPSTTLFSAITDSKATTIYLASTTNVVKGTGLFTDLEFMTVTDTPTGATNAPVKVRRGVIGQSGPPALHASGQVVWLALTPDKSVIPGSNGFDFGSQFGDYGPCTRSSIIYLPHFWPSRGLVRDCAGGQWVNYTELGQTSTNGSLSLLSASGAVQASGGDYVVTKAGVAALTLAAPTAAVQDGAIIRISSTTANAHTLTATGLLQTGTASVNVATFAAQAGAGLTLMAYNGKWIVLYSVGITFS